MARKTGKNSAMFWESHLLNNRTYQQYYQRLTELSVVMFDWQNIPETIDKRFLELTLFRYGRAIIFKDEELGWLALPVTTGGGFDVYGIPTTRTAFASNGYRRELDETNSVIVYNNYLHTDSMLDVEMFARRLYDMDRTIDVNIKAQKTPVVIRCNEQQRTTMLALYKKYEGNEPFIFGDKNLDLNGMTVMKTDAPFIADKVRQEKNQTWNEALTYMGISNANTTKKERLVTDEVIRAQGGTIASRYSRLEMRRQACVELANKWPDDFGKAECNYREDFREADDEVMLTGETGDNSATDMVVDLRTN